MVPTSCTLDAVGHDVNVDKAAQVHMPGLRPKPRHGVLVKDTPDCASLAELVEEECYDYRPGNEGW